MFATKQQRHVDAVERAKRDPTSIGNILINVMNVITEEQLEKALAVQRSEAQLGDILVAMGMVTKDTLEEALMTQRIRRGEVKPKEMAGYLVRLNQRAVNDVTGTAVKLNNVINMSLNSGRLQAAKAKAR